MLASFNVEYLGDVSVILRLHTIKKFGQLWKGEYSIAVPPSPCRLCLFLEGIQDGLLALGYSNPHILQVRLADGVRAGPRPPVAVEPDGGDLEVAEVEEGLGLEERGLGGDGAVLVEAGVAGVLVLHVEHALGVPERGPELAQEDVASTSGQVNPVTVAVSGTV